MLGKEFLWVARFATESNKIEGMGEATYTESNALKTLLGRKSINVLDLEAYVEKVAPGHVLRRQSGQNVRVGEHIAPEGGTAIELALQALLARVQGDGSPGNLTPFDAHVAYETLHPFTDGNGRSGRALWLWQHLRGGTGATPERAKALGFLHTFYYETLANSRGG